jgi:glycerol-3-phosphate dehydrogenase (NAD(P)+)
MIVSVAIVGAGAWGTAIAAHLAKRKELRVLLWARDRVQARAMAAERVNTKYLPGVVLPDTLVITGDLDAAASAELLIVATPSTALFSMASELRAAGGRTPLLWLSKGLLLVPRSPAAPAGVALAHQTLVLPYTYKIGVMGLLPLPTRSHHAKPRNAAPIMLPITP